MTTQSRDSSKFKEEEDLYYYLTVMSLLEGVSVFDLELELKAQEKLENYSACSGILKAIKEEKFKNKPYDLDLIPKGNKLKK